jgi:transcriptional regulator with XRE-family HTH domain
MERRLLAGRLKELRGEHGLSLAQLARATGISSSFLSLVEQAESDITIGRLVRLADFYDVRLADLLEAEPAAPGEHVRILRATSEHMLHSAAEGVDVFDLASGSRWILDPILSVFQRGGTVRIETEHEHERLIFILEGTFELAFQDEATTRLRRGEGAAFHSVHRYRITNVGTGEGRVLGIGMHPQPETEPARDTGDDGGGPT